MMHHLKALGKWNDMGQLCRFWTRNECNSLFPSCFLRKCLISASVVQTHLFCRLKSTICAIIFAFQAPPLKTPIAQLTWVPMDCHATHSMSFTAVPDHLSMAYFFFDGSLFSIALSYGCKVNSWQLPSGWCMQRKSSDDQMVVLINHFQPQEIISLPLNSRSKPLVLFS